MKSDITNRNDIEILVKLFYNKLLQDDAVKEIFEQTVLQHLESHLKTIADFWDSILLDADNYRGNVTEKHFALDKRFTLTHDIFNHWLLHWNTSVDELFDGEKATMAKTRAQSIADIMEYKLDFIRKQNSN